MAVVSVFAPQFAIVPRFTARASEKMDVASVRALSESRTTRERIGVPSRASAQSEISAKLSEYNLLDARVVNYASYEETVIKSEPTPKIVPSHHRHSPTRRRRRAR